MAEFRFATGISAFDLAVGTMAFIDGIVVNVALPAGAICVSQHAVGRSAGGGVVRTVPGGAAADRRRLGDVYGRHKFFAVRVALFSAAPALCGFSPDIRWLVIARGVQGVGGALLIPGSLALISANFLMIEAQRW